MRLEITRKSHLAVRALSALSAHGRMKGPHLAELIGTSQAFIAKVMAPLVGAGWVRSDPGPTGGYETAIDLEKLAILSVIEAIEGPTDDGLCVLRGGPCAPKEDCALHDAWVPARDALLTRLASTPVVAAASHEDSPSSESRSS